MGDGLCFVVSISSVQFLFSKILDDPSPTLTKHNFSPEFCSFVDACLQKDPDARPFADQLLLHPFITKYEKAQVDLAGFVRSVFDPTHRLKDLADMLTIHYYLLFDGPDALWQHTRNLYNESSTFSFSGKEHIGPNDIYTTTSNAVDNWVTHDHRRPINGRMDTHGVYNPEVQVSNDKYKLPVDKEVLLDNNFGRSEIVLDANEAAQPSPWGIPGLNPLSTSVNHHKDDIVPTSLSPSGRLGDVQDSSNSLFSNKDPWNMHHETYFPTSPRPNKVPMKKETCSSKNYFTENLLGNCEEQKLEAQMEDALCEPFKQNLILEQGSVEDHIKQELQAVAEGVAASVLQSSNPSIDELHVANVSGNEESGEGDVKNNLTDKQSKAAKAQDVNSKLQETANLGFPTSDSIGKLQRGTDVAIKRINDRCFSGKASEQERMRADFWNEAIKLADLHHPNVVAFYGVVLDGPGGSVATVTEFMVNGSLRNALQKNERNLDKRKRILIAMDVAFGMEYLHGKNIVHFDLKSDNLLVNLRDPHRPICKVYNMFL
ncbi:hypothetical protein L6164_015937 [Bauhinia variegata]|uniref:Uncharacterized protein n=1 Tax=Bauhinia variegata TaxID=167791 RepID=A0ACB9NN72_BAUVA|nr:hypothetical protein L6164_015937 [Bauhinia variegata]